MPGLVFVIHFVRMKNTISLFSLAALLAAACTRAAPTITPTGIEGDAAATDLAAQLTSAAGLLPITETATDPPPSETLPPTEPVIPASNTPLTTETETPGPPTETVTPSIPGRVNGFVFLDFDGDGVYEPQLGETGLENVAISISASCDADVFLDTVFTSRVGVFQFGNLQPVEHCVRIVIEGTCYQPSKPEDGTVLVTPISGNTVPLGNLGIKSIC
jgi:D-alanyl-D-alanine carboxypeptidase